MPQIDPNEFLELPLDAFAQLDRFKLHDVWQVELPQGGDLTLPELRRFFLSGCKAKPGITVQALFGFRSLLGRLFDLERQPSAAVDRIEPDVPARLRERSATPSGELEGPFTTLYLLPREGLYEIVNSTVHAALVVALQSTDSGQKFYWATYLRPVGRITQLYMGLIDPFRRFIVYPGLERWLQRVWIRLNEERL